MRVLRRLAVRLGSGEERVRGGGKVQAGRNTQSDGETEGVSPTCRVLDPGNPPDKDKNNA